MKKLLLDIALAEYTSLNDHILTKTKVLYQIYLIYFTALGVIYGYILIHDKYYYLLMFVPWMSLALFFRLYYDQQIMYLMSRYIKDHLIPEQLDPLVTSEQEEESQKKPVILQWTPFYENKNLSPYYKHSFFLIFVLFSVGPALIYNLINLSCENPWTSQLTSDIPISSHLILAVVNFIRRHLILAIVNCGIGLYITFMIRKIDKQWW